MKQDYPEAELKAALCFPTNYKKRILPLFYQMMADECYGLKRKMYRKLAGCPGWKRKMRCDHQFAESICQKGVET
jgi:hypothetical protein